MKFLLVAVALLAATQAVSIQRKSFQDNFSDFIEIIIRESGDELVELLNAYEDVLLKTYRYLSEQDFAQIIDEMESLPEFNAVIDFLEHNGIEVNFYISLFHEVLGSEGHWNLRNNEKPNENTPQESNGAVSSYLRDIIRLLPAEDLRDLYTEKLRNDGEFRATMQMLQSKQFANLWDDLWESEMFQGEIGRLRENDIEVEVIVDLVLATLGILGVHVK